MNQGSDYRRALVASQFHRARRRAAIESILSRLSGQPAGLLSFDDVINKLGMSGQSSLGIKQIPIDAIVGSVGRYQDFTRTFLPRLESDEDRWVTVGAAARLVSDLPPIEVYKLGDVYFVQDGNHRVSLARQQNLAYIDAIVTEVRTRVPMPQGVNPDSMIIAAELAAFLDFTRLDLLRPDADMQVSVPGQYRHLENYIEAYRFIVETREERELSYETAVERWYDEAYLPLVQAIREQGILRYFPGRTETDFFVWLARHRAQLENELGVTIAPDVAVARLLTKVETAAEGRKSPLATRLRRLTRLNSSPPMARLPRRTWAQERTLDRYSEHLFTSFLFPVIISEASGSPAPAADSLQRVMVICREETAYFCMLCILDHEPPTLAEATAIESLRDHLRAQPFPTELLTEVGDPIHWTREIGFLNDLVVLERSFNNKAEPGTDLSPAVRELLTSLQRPILLTGASEREALPRRVLVVHDTRRKLDESIFIAAYLAERWHAELTVLALSNGRDTADHVERIETYLGLHEVTAEYLEPMRPNERAAEQIELLAHAGEFDLMVITGPDRESKNNRNNQQTELLWSILQRWPHPTLVAT